MTVLLVHTVPHIYGRTTVSDNLSYSAYMYIVEEYNDVHCTCVIYRTFEIPNHHETKVQQ